MEKYQVDPQACMMVCCIMIIITTYKLLLQAGMQAIHLAATKDIVDILIDEYGIDPRAKVCILMICKCAE